MNEYPLPEDPEAERSLLSTLCCQGADDLAAEYLPLLSEEDFVDPRNKSIFRAALVLSENGGEMGPLGLKDVLESQGTLSRIGGYRSVVELLMEQEVQRPQVLVDVLRRKAKLRKLMCIGSAMIQSAAGELDDPDSLMAGYVEDLSGEIGESRKLKVTSYVSAADKARSGIALLHKDKIPNLVKLGIPTLDYALVARAGSLGIIAGKPSVGKSAMAIQVQTKTPDSLLLSLEMEDEEVEARLLSHHTGLSAEGFLKGLHGPVNVDPTIVSHAHKVTEFRTRDFAGIMAMVKACVRKLGVKVVLVDYFQLLDPPRESNASVAYRLSRMSSSFKALAKDLGICIILLSQFNREVADGERPKLENLKESGGLEQDANWVIMCWTEKPDYKPEEDRIVFMELAKNRGGKRWVKARTTFQPEKTRFVELQYETEVRLFHNDKIRV